MAGEPKWCIFAEYHEKNISNHKMAVPQLRITTATVFISRTPNIDPIGDPINAIIRRNGVAHYVLNHVFLEATINIINQLLYDSIE